MVCLFVCFWGGHSILYPGKAWKQLKSLLISTQPNKFNFFFLPRVFATIHPWFWFCFLIVFCNWFCIFFCLLHVLGAFAISPTKPSMPCSSCFWKSWHEYEFWMKVPAYSWFCNMFVSDPCVLTGTQLTQVQELLLVSDNLILSTVMIIRFFSLCPFAVILGSKLP